MPVDFDDLAALPENFQELTQEARKAAFEQGLEFGCKSTMAYMFKTYSLSLRDKKNGGTDHNRGYTKGLDEGKRLKIFSVIVIFLCGFITCALLKVFAP